MLRIRLKRIGKKHQAFYRIVVAEHTKPVKGEYLLKIGTYNPLSKKIVIDKELAMEWLNKGAKPSNTVAKIFKKEGLKHRSIVIKIYQAKNKQEIAKEKAQKEAEKAKEQADKEAKKAEFEVKQAQEQKEKKEKVPKATATEPKKEEVQKSEEKSEQNPETK